MPRVHGFSVEDADGAVLGRVEYHVDELQAVLFGEIHLIPCHHLVECRDRLRRCACLDVDGRSVRLRNPREGRRLDFPRNVGRRGSEAVKPKCSGVERGERGEGADGGELAGIR